MVCLRNPSRGFTLVELLIVVAIIGVLSMVGIPTYKRMVQKAKTAEAKVLLGGIYKAEAVFRSEFGFYGSNIKGIGFEVSGMIGSILHTNIYAIGFPFTFRCNTGSLQPNEPAIRAAISVVFPGYYSDWDTTYWRKGLNVVTARCLPGDVSYYGTTFTATASGVIAPGVDISTWDSALIDQWTINEKRELINVNDGIQ